MKFNSSKSFQLCLVFLMISLVNCSNSDTTNDTPTPTRNFEMGFTTWPFGPNLQDVDDTYNFIKNNADVYTEHIDNNIPWNAWMNDQTLPSEFTDEINGKVSRRLNKKLLLSVSLFNLNRDDLAEDIDGTVPSYTQLNDSSIEDAYFKHVQYLINQFFPDYLVIAIEVNELRLRAEGKWDAYQLLIQNVTSRIKDLYPNLPISESVSLHNWYDPESSNTSEYILEISNHINQLDFAAISFYPFLKNLHTKNEFQQAFDFLHEHINIPIAFVETSHIAENLDIPNLNVFISSSELEQNIYLETLFENAQIQDYHFVSWWTHRDYDLLWETFPEDLKDIGQLWRDTGLIDENAIERVSRSTWHTYFNLSQ